MKAKDLAELLLTHPEAEVYIHVKPGTSVSRWAYCLGKHRVDLQKYYKCGIKEPTEGWTINLGDTYDA